jgi:hypothetical protein
VTAALWLAAALALFRLLPRLRARGSGLAAVAVAGFMSADLALNNGPNESTALPPAMYEVLRPDSRSPLLAAMKARLAETAAPDRLDRVELTGLGFHWPNASLAHRLHNVLGYNPVRLALYSAATGAGDLALVGSFPDGVLYENPRALPRVLFASRAESADFDAILRSGAWPPVDFSTTVLLSDAPSLPAAPQPSLGGSTVRIVHYGDTEIEIEAEGASAGYLVLNDPYHPWWRASVDGAEAPILRANVLFRAVAVPAGRHTVRFKFRPLLGAWEQLRRR